MSRVLAALALCALAAGCNPFSDALGAPPPARPAAARVPQRTELVCFPCHSQLKFEKGPPFAHASAAHKAVGHCHSCHMGSGHEPREIDRAACLTCHEERSAALSILPNRGTSSN